MAIVRFGTTVIGVRGTIAGTTFSMGPAGPYAKSWRRPRNQSTAIGATSRRAITPYGALWSSMSPTLQNDWKSFAASPPESDFNSLGIQYWLTGYQWLIRANIRRQALGLAPTTTVPTAVAVTAPLTCTLYATAGYVITATIAWSAGDFPTGSGAQLFLAQYPTSGLKSFPGRGLNIWSAYEPTGTSHDISSTVIARYGNIPANWTLFAKLFCTRADGVRSLATIGQVKVI